MDIEELDAFVDAAVSEIEKFRFSVSLSPERMKPASFEVDGLNWSRVPYGDQSLDDVPDDRRGIYAFVICNENGILPPHHYVMYIGIAGMNSDRTLRQRYRDYLNAKQVIKRPKIARMISSWHPVLSFCFATVGDDVGSAKLQAIEKALNGALMPPFSQGDFEADLKRKRSAFQ